MAIALRGTASAHAASGAGSLSVPLPAGTVAGDVLLIEVTVGSTGNVPATPSGLTLITSAALGPSMGWYYRICDGTEPGSYTFTVSATNSSSGIARSYSGVDNVSPINASGTPNRTTTASVTASSITTTVNGCMLVFSGGSGTTATSFTDPGGYGNDKQEITGAGCPSITCDSTQATAGATGAISGAWNATHNSYGELIALAPSGGGGGGSASGSIPTLTLSSVAGTATGDGAAVSTIGTLTLSAPTGSAAGDATAAGAVGTLTLSPLTATATGDGGATGSQPTLTLTAPAGSAQGGAAASGSLGVLTLSAVTGSATGAGGANASGAIGTLTLSSPAGSATGTSGASASGALATLTLSPPAATADAGGRVIVTGPIWSKTLRTFW